MWPTVQAQKIFALLSQKTTFLEYVWVEHRPLQKISPSLSERVVESSLLPHLAHWKQNLCQDWRDRENREDQKYAVSTLWADLICLGTEITICVDGSYLASSNNLLCCVHRLPTSRTHVWASRFLGKLWGVGVICRAMRALSVKKRRGVSPLRQEKAGFILQFRILNYLKYAVVV